MKRILYTLFFLYAFAPTLRAQEEGYKKEFRFGLNFANNSGLIGGAHFRFNRKWTETVSHGFSFDFFHIKNSREAQRQSLATGNLYTTQKMNYLISFRPQYTYTKLIFNKMPESGIRFEAIFSGGPSFGMLTPYYVEVIRGDNTIFQKYDPRLHNSQNISGSGGFFYGLNESTFTLGINAKASLNFEIGEYTRSLKGLETGFWFEWYPSGVNIIAEKSGKQQYLFPTVFLTIFFGSRK